MELQNINSNVYRFLLSSAQLTELLGEAAAGITDNKTQLLGNGEIKIFFTDATSFSETTNYSQVVLPCPTGWQPFTIEATYYDNDQPYTQYVLAANAEEAEAVVQLACYESNQGEAPEADEENWEMLDIESVTPGVHEADLSR
jgi:hypothetical protein